MWQTYRHTLHHIILIVIIITCPWQSSMQNAKLKPLTHLKFISTWVCARRLNKKVMMTCLHHCDADQCDCHCDTDQCDCHCDTDQCDYQKSLSESSTSSPDPSSQSPFGIRKVGLEMGWKKLFFSWFKAAHIKLIWNFDNSLHFLGDNFNDHK